MAKSRNKRNKRARNNQSRVQRQPQPVANSVTAATATPIVDADQTIDSVVAQSLVAHPSLATPPVPLQPTPSVEPFAEPAHQRAAVLNPVLPTPLVFLPPSTQDPDSAGNAHASSTVAATTTPGIAQRDPSPVSNPPVALSPFNYKASAARFDDAVEEGVPVRAYAPGAVWIPEGGAELFFFHTSEGYLSQIHWTRVNDKNTKVLCLGNNCLICALGNTPEIDLVWAVYSPTARQMKLFPTSSVITPKALTPQIQGVLAHNSLPILVHITRPAKNEYKVVLKPVRQGANTGARAFQEFMDQYQLSPFPMNPSARHLTRPEMEMIPELREHAILLEVL